MPLLVHLGDRVSALRLQHGLSLVVAAIVGFGAQVGAAAADQPLPPPVAVIDLDFDFRLSLSLFGYPSGARGALDVWPLPQGGFAAVADADPEIPGGIVRARAALHRRDPDGTVRWVAPINGEVYRTLALPDGARLLLGSFGTLRVLTDGTLDPGFDPETFRTPNAYALLADGRAVGISQTNVLRYGTNGAVDPGFHSPTLALTTGGNPTVESVESLPDGRLIVAGVFTRVDGLRRIGLVRLLADGQVDPSFELPGGVWTGPLIGAAGCGPVERSPGGVRGIRVDDQGRLYLAGDFAEVGGQRRQYVARLGPDGAPDDTFPTVTLPCACCAGPPGLLRATPLVDGSVLVAGRNFNAINDVPRVGIVRLLAAVGSSRVEFVSARTSVPEWETNAVVRFRRVGDLSTPARVRFSTGEGTATPDTDYVPGATDVTFAVGEIEKSVTVTLLPDPFAESDETVPLRLEGDTGVTNLGPGTVAELRVIDDDRPGVAECCYTPPKLPSAEFEGRLVALPDGGYLTSRADANGNMKIVRVRIDGTRDTSFDGPLGVPDVIDRDQEGGIYALGWISDRYAFVRLDSTGRIDSRFQWGRGGPALDALGPAAVDLRGRLIAAAGYPAMVVRRFLADGSPDPDFRPAEADWWVHALQPLRDGRVVVVGAFTKIAGQPSPQLARLRSDGTFDTTFQPPDYGLPIGGTFAELPDGRLILMARGGRTMGGTVKSGLVRLLENGAPDPEFYEGDSPTDEAGRPAWLSALAQQADGRLVVAGNFVRYHGAVRKGLVRLEPDGRLDTSFDPGDGPRFLDTATHTEVAGTVYNLVITADGQLIVRGQFTWWDGVPSAGLARLLLDPRPWLAPISGPPGGPWSPTVSAPPDHDYDLETSTDLARWTAQASARPHSRIFSFPAVTPDQNALTRRFFRVRQR